jgi:hypothetical protein
MPKKEVQEIVKCMEGESDELATYDRGLCLYCFDFTWFMQL